MTIPLFTHIQVVICTACSDYSWNQILASRDETDSLVILKKPFDNVEVLQLAHTLTKKWAVTHQANSRMADLDSTVQQRTQELLAANHLLRDEIRRYPAGREPTMTSRFFTPNVVAVKSRHISAGARSLVPCHTWLPRATRARNAFADPQERASARD